MKKTHAQKCSRFDQKRFNGGCTFCDGYHTWDELYDHRVTLFIALCREHVKGRTMSQVWRSKKHHDGTMYDGGWFIMGIGRKHGEQISYHLPISKWEQADFADTLENAPEFDGHSSDDVLERLIKI